MKLECVFLAAIALLVSSCGTSGLPREREIEVVVKPRFQKISEEGMSAYYKLWYVNSMGKRQNIYWPKEAPSPSSLAKNRDYTVQMFEAEWLSPFDEEEPRYWIPELNRVYDGNKLLYDSSICEVHRIAMKRKVVPLIYGFPIFDSALSKARQNEFPNSGDLFGGGCIPDPDRVYSRTWVCPKCFARKKSGKRRCAMPRR